MPARSLIVMDVVLKVKHDQSNLSLTGRFTEQLIESNSLKKSIT